MSVSRAMIIAVLAIVTVGGVGLMWARTPECKSLIRDGAWTIWDGSDPACQHLFAQGRQQ